MKHETQHPTAISRALNDNLLKKHKKNLHFNFKPLLLPTQLHSSCLIKDIITTIISYSSRVGVADFV
jgi:hypothetical protein